MDIGTHALVSLALVRGTWRSRPAAPRVAWIIAVIAGVIADGDALSARFGAAAYFTWRRTYSHSFLSALLIAVVLAALYRICASQKRQSEFSWRSAFLLALLAGLLHVLLDACQWRGAALLWPVRERVYAADWLADIDPWIIAILLVFLAMPELLHLVNAEIGSREKKPRGRIAAIAGLALICIYIAGRAVLHANALALLRSRTYQGESARRLAALPESISALGWHGIVETSGTLHLLDANVGPGAAFDPESGTRQFKPEPSAILDAAGKTAAARRFLLAARFPKASVEKTDQGYEVRLRDLIFAAAGGSVAEVGATVELDASGQVVSDELIWVGH